MRAVSLTIKNSYRKTHIFFFAKNCITTSLERKFLRVFALLIIIFGLQSMCFKPNIP